MLKKILAFTAMATLASCSHNDVDKTQSSITSEAKASFVSMFNGKDLNNWVQVNCAPETFTVRDNMIISSGKPTGMLRTEKQYENFIMEVEWRHMKPKGNAGVFIWGEAMSSPGVPFARGVEVQVLENEYGKSDWFSTHGDIFPVHGSTMVPDNGRGRMRSFPTEERSNPAGQWNKYVIVCVNGSIKLSVNGKFVTGGTKCNYKKGYICLESEGSECHFKNLKIYELPASGADKSNTAPLAESFTLFYSGLDLRNFKTTQDTAKTWQSRDWRLVCNSQGKNEHLNSEEAYGAYEIQLDYILPKDADKALFPLVLGNNDTWGLTKVSDSLRKKILQAEKNPAKRNKWNRLRIKRGLKTQSIILNGIVVAKDLPISRAAQESFALRDIKGISFASILKFK